MTTTPLPCRPRDLVTMFVKRYPAAWTQIDGMRSERGKSLPAWPDWCFLPMAGAYAVVSGGGAGRLGVDTVGDVAALTALATWRVTQGIYRFDPSVYDEVRHTPIAGDIPCAVLDSLPEWCVYLLTPELEFFGKPIHGVFAHMEFDANDARRELRMLMDLDTGLHALILHLGPWSIEEAITRVRAESERNGILEINKVDIRAVGEAFEALSSVITPILSLLLFVCSQAGEVGEGKRPQMPVAVRTKGENRLFPPNKATTWDVGVRLGAALRRAYQVQESGKEGESTGTSPRPHVRRAHWHGIRFGPMKTDDGASIPTDQRKFELRWFPPIPVNVIDPDSLVPTIRPVN